MYNCHFKFFVGPYVALVPIYTFLLMFMVWRAVSRVQLFEDLWTWTKLCSCGGGILFALSDLVLGLNKFNSPIPYANMIIMISYYAAQLGIALSVVDSTSIAVISAAHSNDSNQCCQSLENNPAQSKRVVLKGKSESISTSRKRNVKSAL